MGEYPRLATPLCPHGNGVTREVIKTIETNDDGTFSIELEEGISYDLVITKTGYLTYTITHIELETGIAIELEEIELVAGNVIGDGEIELDDLVLMNDNYGIIITEENALRKAKYDLNEDGIVDLKDREILMKNYGKVAENVQWKK